MRTALLALVVTTLFASTAYAQTPAAAHDCIAAARVNGIEVRPEFDGVSYTLVEAGALCVDIGMQLRARRRGDIAAQMIERGLQTLRASGDSAALEENLRRPAGRQEAQRLRNAQLAAADAVDANAPARPGRRIANGESSTVSVLFATTRRVRNDGRAPEDYSSWRSSNLSYGEVTVRVPGVARFDDLPSRFSLLDTAVPVVGAIEPLSNQRAFNTRLASLTDRAAGRGEVLVFIHGYNTSFEGAARMAGRLASVLELDGAPVVFSWPSWGSPLGYFVDGGQAEHDRNVDALEEVLEDVVTRSGAKRVYIVAHSMGNRLLVRTLRSIRRVRARNGRRVLFDEIVFASPDVDAREFGDFVTGARGLTGRMTLYASNGDRALELSQKLHFSFPRAGQVDPPTLIAGLDTIDTSAAEGGGYGHEDFIGPARDDLRGLLWLSQPPAQRCVLQGDDREPAPLWSFTPTPPCETRPYLIALWYVRQHPNDLAAAEAALTAAAPPAALRAHYEAARVILAGFAEED
jgi:esterase/lipase superfamily enzyme